MCVILRFRGPAQVSNRAKVLTESAKNNLSPTKMTGRPGHWSEPGEYNILFLGSILVISSQDSSDLGIGNPHKRVHDNKPIRSQRRNKRTTRAKRKKCCCHLVPSSDFLVQSYAVPNLGSSGRESQKSLSHCPNPVSHRGKLPKKGLRTVQETVLGVSPRRPENTLRTLVKHFFASLVVLTVVLGTRNRKCNMLIISGQKNFAIILHLVPLVESEEPQYIEYGSYLRHHC